MGRPFGRCAQLAWDDSLTGSGEPWPSSSKALSVEQWLAYSFPPISVYSSKMSRGGGVLASEGDMGWVDWTNHVGEAFLEGTFRENLRFGCAGLPSLSSYSWYPGRTA